MVFLNLLNGVMIIFDNLVFIMWLIILLLIFFGVNGWLFSKIVMIFKIIKIINKILKDESCFLFFFFFFVIFFYIGIYFFVFFFFMINYLID